jgi:hypothetical protein
VKASFKASSSSSSKQINHPVTFHKQIKSSGYGFLQPKVQLGKAKPAPVKIQPGLSRQVMMPLGQQLAANRQYPMESSPPVVFHPEIVLPDNQPVHPAAGIVRLAYSGRFRVSSQDGPTPHVESMGPSMCPPCTQPSLIRLLSCFLLVAECTLLHCLCFYTCIIPAGDSNS